MSVIVKLMNAVRGNDAHPRQGYRLITGVIEVDFEEPEGGRPAMAHMTFDNADPIALQLDGNVYVMNEAGQTISSFQVAPRAPATAAAA